MGKESILGRIEGEEVYVTAMHPGQRCTPASIASHAMYERTNPYREYVAGGYVDMSKCAYRQTDPKTTLANRATFVADEVCKVKIEGAGLVGQPTIVVLNAPGDTTGSGATLAVNAREHEQDRKNPTHSSQAGPHTFGRLPPFSDQQPKHRPNCIEIMGMPVNVLVDTQCHLRRHDRKHQGARRTG